MTDKISIQIGESTSMYFLQRNDTGTSPNSDYAVTAGINPASTQIALAPSGHPRLSSSRRIVVEPGNVQLRIVANVSRHFRKL